MSLIIPLILILMFFCFVIGYRNKYTYFMILMLLSVVGILYATFILIFKTGYYYRIPGILGNIDYDLFFWISNLKLSYNSIIRIYNVSISVFLISSVYYVLFYTNEKKMMIVGKSISRFFYILIFPIWYFIFYDPEFVYYIYTRIYLINYLKEIIYVLDIINYFMIVYYALLPLFIIISKNKKNKTYIRKKRMFFVAISVSILEILFTLSLCVGLYRVPYVFTDSILQVKYVNLFFGEKTYLALMFSVLVFIFVIYYITSKNNITANIGFIKQGIFKRNLNSINKNYINTFHSVKNVIFSYKIMLERARTETPDKREEILAKLDKKMDSYIRHISMMLNLEDANVEIEFEKTNCKELVAQTLEKLNFDESRITIQEKINPDLTIDIDMLYMTEALGNIIDNAVEAIQKSGKENGNIIFENDVDGEWCVLKITDNGVGMTKKDVSNLFKPFYTTKSRMTNWGVGLSFAYKIIAINGGYISVDSKVDEGTTFYIYLPEKTYS